MKAAIAIVILALLSSGALAQQVLKHMPPRGSLQHGLIVLVDDGTCPKGQIKQVVAGNSAKHIRRQVHCIRRK
jgi:hypothetical protein